MTQIIEQGVLESVKTTLVAGNPKRTLCVGDIHGGYKSLLQVLQKCNFDPEEDQLICLGDYVDGWSESAQVVEFLLELEQLSVHKPIFLRGNHDVWCQEWLNTGVQKDIWVMQGGQATIESYIATGHLVKQEHKDFFNKLHDFYIDDQNRGFVHGGFRSKAGLGHEAYHSDYYWDRTLWELAVAVHNNYKAQCKLNQTELSNDFDEFFRPNPYRFEKHKEIFIGHTATTNWLVKKHLPEYAIQRTTGPITGPITVPMHRCNIWNMDTGGGFNGKISAMDVVTKELFQSDSVKALYPKEHGRG